jgi:hypothetical protein
MAIRCFASEGIVYRTAGMVDAELEASDHSQPDYIRKGIEEFAAECSICKVVCSEALGYCVDEAVQIYGGYGFHADYPPDRAYRDARINRIFEGTNEINRMLTTNMLLKKGVLGRQTGATGLKGLFMTAAGVAVAKFGQGLAEQQEVLAGLSEIAFEAYTSETAMLRTMKLETSEQAIDMMAVHLSDSYRRAAAHAEDVLAACSASPELQEAARGLTRPDPGPQDTVAIRRRICGRLLDAGKYFV